MKLYFSRIKECVGKFLLTVFHEDVELHSMNTTVQTTKEYMRFCALMDAQTWIFAKTMPQTPHEYTLRKKWRDEADFVWAVEYIRRVGYQQKFGKTTYTYLDYNGQCYWTMGSPIEKTILINRAVKMTC